VYDLKINLDPISEKGEGFPYLPEGRCRRNFSFELI